MKLKDLFVSKVKFEGKPAKYSDGDAMYLLVKEAGKYWRMDYAFARKRKTLALGVYPDVSLAQARERRRQARMAIAAGSDPGVVKRAEKVARVMAAASTFEAVAREWLAKTRSERADNTQGKVEGWLKHDVFPYIGNAPIASITPTDILHLVLRRIEQRGALDTAHRVKQICGRVFRYAIVCGLTTQDVTASLGEALASKPTSHHAAIVDPQQFGKLLRAIHGYEGHAVTVAALRLAPLLFVRPGELRKAEWPEINLEAREWRIPGSKMKMGNDHIVPLPAQAVRILQDLQPLTGHGKYVFPSIRTGERPMSDATMNAALRGMGYASEVHTAHGFRASARTLLAEQLDERVEHIEHQLAHTVKDPNGRAYNRTQHLDARRGMMQRWADYLDALRLGGEVIQFQPLAA